MDGIGKRPSTHAVRRKGTEHKGTLGKAQKDVNGLWDNGWELDDRSECWAKHIHREHKKAADDWADRGMNGEHFLWETNKEVEDRNTARICGFWDGNYRDGRCGVENRNRRKDCKLC